ncbi:MAG TPA: hypothetical protein PKO06_05595, partial [Candidatus Ozemobacteraceae bacterium]|nr:hypothetical protein [Candidatus Ozemobacteraceae bacterium]
MRGHRDTIGLVLIFFAAFSMGFAIESRWGEKRSLATRGDAALEVARVLNALQPLLRPWETRAGPLETF